MKPSLSGRTLCIVGGNGFVGTALAHQAVTLGAKVFGVSRSGTKPSKSPWADKVQWIKGDAMNPESFRGALEESEAVVHTIGILIDSSVTQFKKPGEEGTYEQMNRDSAIAVGNLLNDLKNKKMVYLSASRAPPFLDRYLTTKREAENYLFGLPNLRTTSLRPGFISSDEVPHKKLLSYPIGLYAHGYRLFNKLFNADDTFLRHFNADTTVDVRAVALSALIASFDPKFDGKILYNDDMETLKERFLEKGYEFSDKKN